MKFKNWEHKIRVKYESDTGKGMFLNPKLMNYLIKDIREIIVEAVGEERPKVVNWPEIVNAAGNPYYTYGFQDGYAKAKQEIKKHAGLNEVVAEE